MRVQALRAAVRRERAALTAALVHWLLSFGLERLVFTAAPTAHLFDYVLCKLLLLVLLFAFWRLLFCAVREKGFARRMLLRALPVLAALLVYLFLYHPFTLEGDELNIYQHAVQFDSFAYWFNYPTGYYWILCLMVVPHAMGPIFIKVLLQALIAGYLVARQERLSGKAAWLLYVLFCLPFVLELGISAHRLPIYGMLYLLLAAKLLYDRLEHKALDRRTLLLLSLLIGLLAIWRTEGIYLAVLGAVLLAVAYRVKLNRQVWKRLLAYALALLLVAVPQLKGYFIDTDVSLGVRTKPLCAYALCNMFRNGLTREMLSGEEAAIEGYLPLSVIEEYNANFQDGNYARAQVMQGALDADYAAQEAFCGAVKRIILRHPLIYLRAQWNAWLYTSSQYTADFSGGAAGLWRGVRALTYRVNLPTYLVALFLIAALLRKKWMTFWLCGCALTHWALVTLLMPAAFAKYFYVDYLLGYFLLLMGLIWLISRRRGCHAHAAT